MTITAEQGEITKTLLAYHDGDEGAFERLVALLYDDLRGIARRQLQRARPGSTLNTTGLVHEAYIKLVDASRIPGNDRAHFLAIIGRAMRQIVVDYARKKYAEKRGGHQARVPLYEAEIAVQDDVDQLINLDDAMSRLAELDERLVRIVECRFFAGMTEQETASALQVSRSTVQREWIRARAWLRKDLCELSSSAHE